MKSHINNIDETLLAKYLDGSTTHREKVEVEVWLEKDPENRQVFNHFQKIWDAGRGVKSHNETGFDKKAAFQNVLKRIEKETGDAGLQTRPSRKPIKLIPLFARIAAVFIIGISLYFIYQDLSPATSEEMVTDTNESVQFLVSEEPFITLPDDSFIHLHEGGEIKYTKNFLENRLLSLSGEAFFEVKTQNEKPFIVEAEGLEVKVLGTSFYIIAHENHPLIEVGVKTGRVQVSHANHQKSILLEKNETVTYNKVTKSFGQPKAFNSNKLFWVTGVLEFNEQPLDQVLSTLSLVYDTEIIFQKTQLENCKFTGRFQQVGLDEIIDLLQISFSIDATMGEKVLITGKTCE